MYKVFVYGTLKSGEPNHSLLKERCKGQANFLGKASTTNKYPLIIGTKYNIPFLLYSPGKGNIIKGEVYEVDQNALYQLDELEGHPDYYVREIDKFMLHTSEGSENEVECWVYFLKDFPEAALNKTYYSDYSSYGEHNLRYLERSKRDPSHSINSRQFMLDQLKQ